MSKLATAHQLSKSLQAMDTMNLQFLPLRAQNDCHKNMNDRTAKLQR